MTVEKDELEKLHLSFEAVEIFDGVRGLTFSYDDGFFTITDVEAASLVRALSEYLEKAAR